VNWELGKSGIREKVLHGNFSVQLKCHGADQAFEVSAWSVCSKGE
jgi:hypothetical protein